MAVGPVTLNGIVPRTQDMSVIKHQEDNKPLVEQQNIQTQLKAQEERHLKQVNHADDAHENKKKYDAKEKGSNQYEDRRNKKKKPNEKKQNTVTLKQGSGRFDMKI